MIYFGAGQSEGLRADDVEDGYEVGVDGIRLGFIFPCAQTPRVTTIICQITELREIEFIFLHS